MSQMTTRASAVWPVALRQERHAVRNGWENERREEKLAASETDRARMVERHKLVVNIIDINSQQLRCESAIAGLDIERACAARDVESAKSSPASRAVLSELDRRMTSLSDESQRLATQREFLNSALSEFDEKSAGGENAPGDVEPVGRA